MKNKFAFLLSINLIPLLSPAQGGGWVGNSPISVASNDLLIPSEKLYALTTDDLSNNYFLNLKGDHAFDLLLGYQYSKNDKSMLLGARYSYGITDNVTFSAPLVFTFGLINNHSVGHELALIAGIPAFGYGSDSGFVFLPTLGAEYTWGGEKVRVVADVLVSKSLQTRKQRSLVSESFNDGFYISSSAKVIYRLVDWMSIEAGARTAFKSVGSMHHTIYAGPEVSFTKNFSLFMRATYDNTHGQGDFGGLGGLKLSF